MAGGGEDDETAIEQLTGQTAPGSGAAPQEITTEDLLGSVGADDAEDASPVVELENTLDAIGVEEGSDSVAEESTSDTEPQTDEPNN